MASKKCWNMRGASPLQLLQFACDDKYFAKWAQKAPAAYRGRANFSCLFIFTDEKLNRAAHTRWEAFLIFFLWRSKRFELEWVSRPDPPCWLPKLNTAWMRQKLCHLIFVATLATRWHHFNSCVQIPGKKLLKIFRNIFGCFLAEVYGDAEMRIHCKAFYSMN